MLRENLNSVSLAGMSTVSTVRMHRWKQHKLWTNHCVDHTPQCRFMCNSSYSNTSLQWRCSRSICSNVESTTRLSTGTTKNRPHLSLRSRLSGLLSRPLKSHGASHRLFKNASLWPPLLYTQHCNSDQLWALWTCSKAHLLCPPGKDKDYI